MRTKERPQKINPALKWSNTAGKGFDWDGDWQRDVELGGDVFGNPFGGGGFGGNFGGGGFRGGIRRFLLLDEPTLRGL